MSMSSKDSFHRPGYVAREYARKPRRSITYFRIRVMRGKKRGPAGKAGRDIRMCTVRREARHIPKYIPRYVDSFLMR